MSWEQKISPNSQQKAQRDRDLKDLVGEVIADKYKVIDILGRGGSGIVFHVEQTFLGTHLALKLPTFNLFDGEAESLRFQREAKASGQLHHSNLIKIYDFGVLLNKQPYLVMELVRGLSLSEYLKAHGPLSVEEATAVFSQAASGLKFAHDRGIVHRDIKPGNIMLVSGVPLGAPGFVKILDFGIAKVGAENGQTLTQTGDVFGTPSYMSPEQCDGKKVDLRADIYSLGCSFYEALVGTPPFFGASYVNTLILHQTAPIPTLEENSLGRKFPQKFEDIIKKMLQKDANDRYQNLGDFIADLNAKESIQQPFLDAPQKPAATNDNSKSKKAIFGIGIATTLLIGLIFLTDNQFQHSGAPKSDDTHKPVQTVSLVNELDRPFADQVNRDSTARIFFEKSPPIISKIVSVDGHSTKAFMFPETAIGAISAVDRRIPGGNFSKDAVGAVYVPPNMELNLDIGGDYNEAFKYPEIFKKIGPTEFASLSITPPITLRLTTREEKNIELSEILNTASHWTHLRNLKLQTFKLNKESLDAIDRMKALTSLSLIDAKGSETDICKRKFLQRMEGLLIDACSVNEFLAPLSRSKKLKNFGVKFSVVDDNEFKLLQRYPHLECVHIIASPLSDSMCDVISRCPKLTSVVIENCKINIKQLHQLAISPSLKTIFMKHVYPIDFTPAAVADPRVKFEQ